MKKSKNILSYPIFLLSLFLLILSSCDEDVEAEFDLPLGPFSVDVPALGAPFNEFKIFTSEVITTGIETALNENGASLNNIQSINLKSLNVEITEPAGATFDNVLFLEAYLLSPGNDSTKIAFTEGSLDGLTSVNLSSQFSDLSPHVSKDEFTLLIRGYIDEAKPATTLEVDFEVTVKVKTPE